MPGVVVVPFLHNFPQRVGLAVAAVQAVVEVGVLGFGQVLVFEEGRVLHEQLAPPELAQHGQVVPFDVDLGRHD